MDQNSKRIIVCGGGLAGLSAAVTVLENGAAVTLIEKAPELGGTTMVSGGLLWTFADYEELRAKVPCGDSALQWLVYDTIDESRAWLQQLGARLGPVERVLDHGRGQTVDPSQLIQVLADRFSALGGELLLETAIESLIASDGIVHGARTLKDGKLAELFGSAVILATGGFQGNHELLGRYVVRDPDNLALRAGPWSTGDALIAATRIGAAASPGLDSFYGHALAASPARYTKFQFRDISQYHGGLSVALNLHGERFADETDGTGEEALNQRLAHQPQGRGIYVVDHDAMEVHPVQGRDAITRTILERTRSAGGTVVEANTLEKLCQGLAASGVPAQRALSTLREFNAAMQNGRADELRPGRRRHRKPLARPPFRASVVQAAITFTSGGLQIDERARVLWRAGSTSSFAPVPTSRAYAETNGPAVVIGSDYRQMPIRGLYAAGNDTGNISHFGYMGGLAGALTTGRTAGREAAGLVGTAKRPLKTNSASESKTPRRNCGDPLNRTVE